MNAIFLRRLLTMLTAFAFLSGAGTQAMPSIQDGSMLGARAAVAGMPCDQMAAMTQAAPDTGDQPMPCKGLTPECAKQMGCIGVSVLPVHPVSVDSVVQYSYVTYWTPQSALIGLSRQPDPFPPRTI